MSNPRRRGTRGDAVRAVDGQSLADVTHGPRGRQGRVVHRRMATATILLKAFEQTKQTIKGPGGDEMHGRVVFDVETEGKRAVDCRVDVKLVIGGTYEVDAIEVGRPVGYRGPPYPNHQQFAEHVERYVRGAVGKNGWAIRIGPGCSNIVMIGNMFVRPQRCSVDATNDGGGW
jgi:hypothetical protein